MFQLSINFRDCVSPSQFFPDEYAARQHALELAQAALENAPGGRRVLSAFPRGRVTWQYVSPYVSVTSVVGEWIEVETYGFPEESTEERSLVFETQSGDRYAGYYDAEYQMFVACSPGDETKVRPKTVERYYYLPEPK